MCPAKNKVSLIWVFAGFFVIFFCFIVLQLILLPYLQHAMNKLLEFFHVTIPFMLYYYLIQLWYRNESPHDKTSKMTAPSIRSV